MTSNCVNWPSSLEALKPCYTDDRQVDYCTVYPWPLEHGNRFGEAMTNLDTQSIKLYDTYSANCNPQTDFGGHQNYQSGEFTLGTTTLGYYLCTTRLMPLSAKKCDQASIIYNQTTPYLRQAAYGAKPYWTVTQMYNARRNVFCHEVGHGLGFYHGTGYGGCLELPNWSLSNLTIWTGYHTHHAAHMDFFY